MKEVNNVLYDDMIFVTRINIDSGDITEKKITMLNLQQLNFCFEETMKYNNTKSNTYTVIVTNGSSFKVKELMKDFLPTELYDKMVAYQVKEKLLKT